MEDGIVIDAKYRERHHMMIRQEGDIQMDMKLEKARELSRNEEFLKKLLTTENAEDVKKLFEENGVEMTSKDVEILGEKMKKTLSGGMTAEDFAGLGPDELSEHELAKVAGGLPDGMSNAEAVALTICAELFYGPLFGTLGAAAMWNDWNW